jgi:hypothetical protein
VELTPRLLAVHASSYFAEHKRGRSLQALSLTANSAQEHGSAVSLVPASSIGSRNSRHRIADQVDHHRRLNRYRLKGGEGAWRVHMKHVRRKVGGNGSNN